MPPPNASQVEPGGISIASRGESLSVTPNLHLSRLFFWLPWLNLMQRLQKNPPPNPLQRLKGSQPKMQDSQTCVVSENLQYEAEVVRLVITIAPGSRPGWQN